MTETHDTFERNAREFWTSQDKILDNLQDVANGWFARRHAGTQAALDAAQRMCRAATPAELLLEYQTWVMGAWERVVADVVACQGCGIAIERLMGGPLASSVDQAAVAIGEAQAGIVVPSLPTPAAVAASAVQPPPLRKTSGVRASSAA
jgi:hypothetical protein